MRRLLLSLLVLLAACSTAPTLPTAMPALDLPVQLLIQKQTAQEARDLILVVQQDPAGLRWSLLDPIGMPLARQLLQDGAWSNDGLVPPNPDAHALFAALLFAWTPGKDLAISYPAGSWKQESATTRSLWQDGEKRWDVVYADASMQRFTLRAVDGTAWQVGPLPGAVK
ncbi:DUF3261 domain-containing protein [Pigmentiphaga aceris]|uniref:DUF3261 domain-containing protein n=1 Tax=Pigmentiphaga aceris TaxID=1940612 RepID=A0A5C0B0Z8_9BURK|nr:DUF3261 domain-containing protein [Pigmentiphaga aceris]QEI07636.1 DUF3261 domain-containing protein [Pigmentiphaga aceris]